MKKSLKNISLALVVSTSLLSSAISMADEQKLKETDIQKLAINLANQTIQGGYKLVTIEHLKEMIDNKEDFVLVDAHPRREFIDGYINGATNFGFQSKHTGEWNKDLDIDGGATQEQYRKVLGNDLNKKIVIYCGMTKCGRSHNASWWAKFMGYTNVYRAPGGVTAWKDAGYPYKTIK